MVKVSFNSSLQTRIYTHTHTPSSSRTNHSCMRHSSSNIGGGDKSVVQLFVSQTRIYNNNYTPHEIMRYNRQPGTHTSLILLLSHHYDKHCLRAERKKEITHRKEQNARRFKFFFKIYTYLPIPKKKKTRKHNRPNQERHTRQTRQTTPNRDRRLEIDTTKYNKPKSFNSNQILPSSLNPNPNPNPQRSLARSSFPLASRPPSAPTNCCYLLEDPPLLF